MLEAFPFWIFRIYKAVESCVVKRFNDNNHMPVNKALSIFRDNLREPAEQRHSHQIK